MKTERDDLASRPMEATIDKAEEIFEELRQLIEQYNGEVVGQRRTWPLSIRERIGRLQLLGVSDRQIGMRTGVPLATVSLWGRINRAQHKPKRSRRKAAFLPVAVTDSETQAIHSQSSESKFGVLLPGGIRVNGLSLSDICELSRRLTS